METSAAPLGSPRAEVRIQDTLSGELAAGSSRASVGIYACGPTVYSRIHVGNARAFVIAMLLAGSCAGRAATSRSSSINVTDVNDKIYAAAARGGRATPPSTRSAMTAAYIEDTDALGLGRPDAEPLATETIAEIVELIEALIERGHAYESGGDVYFRVRSFDGYGELSNRDPDEMDQGEEAGTRVLKESPLDFALWKATKEGEDTSWDSPWGPGRPGWHIECSAMAERELGVPFAIHAGGLDLRLPPPRERDRADPSRPRRAARPHLDAQRDGHSPAPEAKMAKSEGNVFLLAEAISTASAPRR